MCFPFPFSSRLKHDQRSVIFSFFLHLSQSVFLSLCFLLMETHYCVSLPSVLLKTGTIITHAKEEELVGGIYSWALCSVVYQRWCLFWNGNSMQEYLIMRNLITNQLMIFFLLKWSWIYSNIAGSSSCSTFLTFSSPILKPFKHVLFSSWSRTCLWKCVHAAINKNGMNIQIKYLSPSFSLFSVLWQIVFIVLMLIVFMYHTNTLTVAI